MNSEKSEPTPQRSCDPPESPSADVTARYSSMSAEGLLRELVKLEKQKETMQKESKHFINALADHIPALLGYWTPELNYTFASKKYTDWFGRSHEEMQNIGLKELVGEELFQIREPYIRAALRGEHQSFEGMVTKVDGESKHVMVQYSPHIMEGEVQGVFGLVTDITQIKQGQELLRIAAVAFESQEGMMITDANSVILRVNRAFTEITGYPAEESVGQTPRLFKSGRHSDAFYSDMWECIKRTGSWQGEIWDRRKNGEIYPKWLTITAVKSKEGVVTHYVGAHSDISARKAAEDVIKNKAFYDPLTQLPNRWLLNDRLSQVKVVCKRSRCYGAILFLDLDNFKPINDSHGHIIGDLLLIEVASRLSKSVRGMDTVARFGGDEFVIMLAKLDVDKAKSMSEAETIAEKIRASLSEPYLLSHPEKGQLDSVVECHCTTSIGVALFNDNDNEINQDDLFKKADSAMYKAKEAGRNLIRVYERLT